MIFTAHCTWPVKTNPRLAENFDEQFKKIKVDLTPPNKDTQMILSNMTGNEFNGFSWASPSFFDGIESIEDPYQHPSSDASTTL